MLIQPHRAKKSPAQMLQAKVNAAEFEFRAALDEVDEMTGAFLARDCPETRRDLGEARARLGDRQARMHRLQQELYALA